MSAVSFPLTTDISSAANEVSSSNAEQLPAGGSGRSAVLRPDTVTLSAVFPPPPPVDTANSVQFQVQDQGPAQPALEAFPPAPIQTINSPAQLLPVANATTPATPTQQEQLAQLDRVLRQLGINPQSISLDNRLALIKSENDPPALLNLVRTLGVLNQSATASAQAGVLFAKNVSSPVPTGTQAQIPAPSESQAQPPAAFPAPPQGSSPLAGSGFESTLQANPGSLGHAHSVSDAAAQFQELQAVFQGTDAQNPASGTASPSLNIRA
jgi:hypothetical protein